MDYAGHVTRNSHYIILELTKLNIQTCQFSSLGIVQAIAECLLHYYAYLLKGSMCPRSMLAM